MLLCLHAYGILRSKPLNIKHSGSKHISKESNPLRWYSGGAVSPTPHLTLSLRWYSGGAVPPMKCLL